MYPNLQSNQLKMAKYVLGPIQIKAISHSHKAIEAYNFFEKRLDEIIDTSFESPKSKLSIGMQISN